MSRMSITMRIFDERQEGVDPSAVFQLDQFSCLPLQKDERAEVTQNKQMIRDSKRQAVR